MALNSNFRTLTADNIEGLVDNRNYLKSSFENGTIQGWTEMAVTLTSGLPTGTPTISSTAASSIALSATSITPLSGARSLLVTGAAGWTAGQGFISDEFTLDRMDLGKVLTVTFDYERVSGTLNFSGTLGSQTLMVYIYDATAGAANWIQPAGYLGMNQSSGPGRVTATFQTSVVSSQKYRIAVIASQAVVGACSIEFDNFACSRVDPPIGQLRNPAGTIISTGSLTPPSGYLYCNGSAISRADYSELFSAIGTTYGTGNGTTTFNIPDLRGIFPRGAGTNPSNAANTTTMGNRQLDDFKSHNHTSTPIQIGGGTFTTSGNYLGQNGPSVAGPGTQSTGGTETRPANLGVAYHICFSSGSVQMSNDTDTRVVAFEAKNNTAFAWSGGVYTTINAGWSATRDTHSGFNSSNGTFTVPVSGYWVFRGGVVMSTLTVAFSTELTIQAGSNEQRIGRYFTQGGSANTPAVTGTTTPVYCNAGDIVSIRVFSTSAMNLTADVNWNVFGGYRLSGPSVIAASETVAAVYQTGAGQSIPNNTVTPIVYGTKFFDTHSAMNASTGVYSVPVSGTYEVKASHYFGTAILATATDVQTIVQVDGVSMFGSNLTKSGTAATPLTTLGSFLVKANAGQTIRIALLQSNSTASAQSLLANVTFNWISINRVGN